MQEFGLLVILTIHGFSMAALVYCQMRQLKTEAVPLTLMEGAIHVCNYEGILASRMHTSCARSPEMLVSRS